MPVEISSFCVVVLQDDPPPIIMAREMAVEIASVLQEGARLRERLPAYLAKRYAFLNECCSLIVEDMVSACLMPTSTEQLRATRLGENHLHADTYLY
jgi:hypothetical protein